MHLLALTVPHWLKAIGEWIAVVGFLAYLIWLVVFFAVGWFYILALPFVLVHSFIVAPVLRIRRMLKWAGPQADVHGYRLESQYPVREYRDSSDNPIYFIETARYRLRHYQVCVTKTYFDGRIKPHFCDPEGNPLPPKLLNEVRTWGSANDWWEERRRKQSGARQAA